MLILFFLIMFVVPAQASTIYSTGYEYADMTALQADGWTLTCSSSPCTTDLVSSTRTGAPPHSGSKMLRQTYSPTDGTNDAFNSKIDRNWNGVPEIYIRYFVRYEKFDPAQASSFAGASKQHYINQGSNTDFIINYINFDDKIHLFNQDPTTLHFCPSGATPTGRTDPSCNLLQNAATVHIGYDQWYCIEAGLTQSAAKLWVNGTLVVNYAQPIPVGSSGQTGVIYPTTYFRDQIYRQSAVNQIRYEDDYVVSTTRIECGSVQTDTTPPARPTGVGVN